MWCEKQLNRLTIDLWSIWWIGDIRYDSGPGKVTRYMSDWAVCAWVWMTCVYSTAQHFTVHYSTVCAVPEGAVICVCVIRCVWALNPSFPSHGWPARRHLSQTLVRPLWCGAAPHGCSWSGGRWRLGALPGPFSLSWGRASVWPPCESEPGCCWGHRHPWQEAGTAGRPSSGGSCLSSGRLVPRPWASSLHTGREEDGLWLATVTG